MVQITAEELKKRRQEFQEEAGRAFDQMLGVDGQNGLVTFAEREERACALGDQVTRRLLEEHLAADDAADPGAEVNCPLCGRAVVCASPEKQAMQKREVRSFLGHGELGFGYSVLNPEFFIPAASVSSFNSHPHPLILVLGPSICYRRQLLSRRERFIPWKERLIPWNERHIPFRERHIPWNKAFKPMYVSLRPRPQTRIFWGEALGPLAGRRLWGGTAARMKEEGGRMKHEGRNQNDESMTKPKERRANNHKGKSARR